MDVWQFYGIDWVATVCGLLGIYFLGNKNKIGFVLFMAASLSWVTFGIMTGSIAVVIGSTIFLLLHIRGLWMWRKQVEVIGQEV